MSSQKLCMNQIILNTFDEKTSVTKSLKSIW